MSSRVLLLFAGKNFPLPSPTKKLPPPFVRQKKREKRESYLDAVLEGGERCQKIFPSTPVPTRPRPAFSFVLVRYQPAFLAVFTQHVGRESPPPLVLAARARDDFPDLTCCIFVPCLYPSFHPPSSPALVRPPPPPADRYRP